MEILFMLGFVDSLLSIYEFINNNGLLLEREKLPCEPCTVHRRV